MRVLLAGGSGRLGTLVAQRLHARGVTVRVLTRDERRCQHLAGVADEVVVGDLREPATLTAPCRDVDVVLSAVQGFAGPGRVTPASVDDLGNRNLIAATATARASMVLLSVVGAAPDHPMELFRAKAAAERALREAGIPFTIVRATAFAELWIEILAKGVVPGRGQNPINFVSVADVADTVERVVLDDATRGQVVEVCGPENLTLDQLAALANPGRRPRHVPPVVLRAASLVSRQARAGLIMDSYDMTAVPATKGRTVQSVVAPKVSQSRGSPAR